MITYARLYEHDNEQTLTTWLSLPADVRHYVATGYTDMRRGVDGMVSIVSDGFGFNPRARSTFLFCGRRADRLKALFFDGDAYELTYRRMESGGLWWPRRPGELWKVSRSTLCDLLSGEPVGEGRALAVFHRVDHAGP